MSLFSKYVWDVRGNNSLIHNPTKPILKYEEDLETISILSKFGFNCLKNVASIMSPRQ